MLISTRNLTKIYRTDEVETTALHAVNLDVAPGEFVALMGPSGCGKSTLMHVLGLIDSASSGTYLFGGTDVTRASDRARTSLRKSSIGFIFQSFNLIDELTVFDNIDLPLRYNGVRSEQRANRVNAILEKMNLLHRAKHFPMQLSGGQQQRVAVARAIVHSPQLIFADEPTGNLDSEHGEEVMKTLQQLNKEGSTIVMVTHSERDAAFGSRVIRMLDGQIAH